MDETELLKLVKTRMMEEESKLNKDRDISLPTTD